MNNFFSIIIPNYNQANFIKECLNSLVKQKYKNYEIIIIDGGSTDNSKKIIKSYAKKYKSISYWHSKKDAGQADAINFGIKKAKGNWITWQNSDDYFNHSNVLKIFNKAINLNPTKKLFVGNMNLVSVKNKRTNRLIFIKPNFNSLLYEGMTLSNQSSFWHNSLNLHLGYLKNWDVDFDYEWYLRILSKFPDCGYHINESLGSYRIHQNQKTFKKNDKKKNRIKKLKKKYGMINNRLIKSIIESYFIFKRFFYYISISEFSYVYKGLKKRIGFLFKN